MNNPAEERMQVIETLTAAIRQLQGNLHPDLVPAEGISFGYAIRGARDCGGIAAVPKNNSGTPERRPVFSEPCRFDADADIGRVILTAMKFDPHIRSAALLAHSKRIETVLCDDLFLESASCDRDGTGGTTTMDWGIASCCKNGVPDVIFCRYPGLNGLRTLIFGEEPADVLNNIIMCSNRI
jgi:hydroxymethylpyrimidine/phosphomethylpyrimidine kinase